MLLIAMSSALTAHSQLAVKTNLLYDATTTPNLGAEVRVGSKSTINLVYGLNAWSFKGDSKVKHWLCRSTDGGPVHLSADISSACTCLEDR